MANCVQPAKLGTGGIHSRECFLDLRGSYQGFVQGLWKKLYQSGNLLHQIGALLGYHSTRE